MLLFEAAGERVMVGHSGPELKRRTGTGHARREAPRGPPPPPAAGPPGGAAAGPPANRLARSDAVAPPGLGRRPAPQAARPARREPADREPAAARARLERAAGKRIPRAFAGLGGEV